MTTVTTSNESKTVGLVAQPLALRIPAMAISIVFHPLFIPVIAITYLAYIQQGVFTGIPDRDKDLIIARVAVNTVFFPLVTVLLLKGVGFIKSVFLRTRRERIIPYVATNIFYFWIFMVFKNQPYIPAHATSFILGVFLASSAGLVLNSFFKISMHTLGMGTLTGFLLLFILTGFPGSTFMPFMVLILVSGLVGTSRMILSDHTLFDLGSGFLVGIVSQVLAAYIFFS
ncbi:MAG: hypothetical protein M9898_10260 [Chitinophagaceae bacterium]|nr:hypothetical protein [Chitinophagaceae bacterium]